ncbi:MAG: ribonuclease HIII [Candidatus Enterosoma sp.]|nr:ribonuclease HIII [Candidatus Enterosoma sp.]
MFRYINQISKERAMIIKDYYHLDAFPVKDNPYLFFKRNKDISNVSVECFVNKKGEYKIMYSSSDKKDLLNEIKVFDPLVKEEHIQEERKKEEFKIYQKQIGSDEVGKGDLFSSIFVVSSYVEESDLKLLEKLNVTDSKTIKDEKHLEIGPTLIKRCKTYCIEVSAKKLTQLHQKGINLNKTLAILHNLAHKKLIEKYSLSKDINVYVDEFVSPSSYKNYVKEDIIKNPLFFHTEGERHYPSVALSSCVARYFFLLRWKEMEEKFKMKISKGAGKEAEKSYLLLRKRFSEEEILPYIKAFFKTFNRLDK